jgi:hypothetical protein
MHIISLSFDDGFERSNLKIAAIYEKFGLSACFNVLALEEVDGEKVFDIYHNHPSIFSKNRGSPKLIPPYMLEAWQIEGVSPVFGGVV